MLDATALPAALAQAQVLWPPEDDSDSEPEPPEPPDVPEGGWFAQVLGR